MAGSWRNTCSTPTWDYHGELVYFNSGAGIDPGQFKRWFDVGEDVSLSGECNPRWRGFANRALPGRLCAGKNI